MKKLYTLGCWLFPALLSAQMTNVTVAPYTQCDTCFTFTANPDTNSLPPYTYQWTFAGPDPGSYTGQTITHCDASVSASDTLFLVITDANNQNQYYFNTLSTLITSAGANNTVQPLCIITVDTVNNKNLLVWEQTTDTMIDSYNIYKETSTSGVYNFIANISRNNLSTFTDTSSHPDIKSARYRLTTLDICGNESQPGPSHKTMHLTISSGIPPAWNLNWEIYDGLSFLKYRIWRYHASTGWQLIDSVSSSSTTYTDPNPPTGTLNYMVEIVSQTVCSPSLKLPSTQSSYQSSLSNIASSASAGLPDAIPLSQFAIYPNPSKGLLTVQRGDIPMGSQMEIVNMLGEEIMSQRITGSKTQLDLGRYSKGMYFVVITSGKGKITRKIILE